MKFIKATAFCLPILLGSYLLSTMITILPDEPPEGFLFEGYMTAEYANILAITVFSAALIFWGIGGFCQSLFGTTKKITDMSTAPAPPDSIKLGSYGKTVVSALLVWVFGAVILFSLPMPWSLAGLGIAIFGSLMLLLAPMAWTETDQS